MNFPSLLAGWLFAGLAAIPLPACAILGGAGVDPNSVDSPWAGVGSISPKQGGTFSGAVIGRNLVLTAAHVVAGHVDSPNDIRFNLNYGDRLSHSFQARSIHILPQFQGARPGPDGIWYGDMAIVELDHDIPEGVPIYELFTDPLQNLSRDDTLTLVGYGDGGDGENGPTTGGDPGVKRVGHNRPDTLIGRAPNEPELFLFDYDRPLLNNDVIQAGADHQRSWGDEAEAGFASGDSGSPIFVHDGTSWKILGVATFNGTTSFSGGSATAYGAIGGATFVAPHRDWIDHLFAQSDSGEIRTHKDRPQLPALFQERYGLLLFALAALAASLRHFRRKRVRRDAM